MRTRIILFLLALGGLCVAQAGQIREQPSVILITLDTTRADRMGFLGSRRGLTPQLDAVALKAVVFTRAYSQAPITTVSHATILTGTYQQTHHVNDFGVPLPLNVPYAPDLFRARGYKTAAFTGSLILDPRNGLAPGFDRGFDTYEAGYRVRQNREDRYQSMERRAEDVVSRTVAWIERNGRAPFFVWIHLYDAHDPYEPPAPFARRYASALYDGEIAYMDNALGKLFATLKAKGIYDNSIIAITSDHGESLGQHGEQTHGVFLYDETIHVPLLVKFPRPHYVGRRFDSTVSLIDVAPTLLEASGIGVPSAMQGQSLLRLLASPEQSRPSFAQTDYPRRAFGWSPLAAWRVGGYLFVSAPRRELYDERADPGSTRNLAESSGSLANRLSSQLDDFRRRFGGEPSIASEPPIDPKIVEKLTALGYAGATRSAPGEKAGGIDPKDRVATANALHDAINLIENGRYDRATPLLDRVVATDPQIYLAQYQLGVARARQRNYAKAIEPLRKAIELLPDAGMAHYELGVALFETGDWKMAAAHFEIAVLRMPKSANAHYSLASVYARTDRVSQAVDELRTALALDDKHPRANLLLGRILALQGKAAEGLPYLEQAVALQPDLGEAHSFLADAYTRLGRTSDAERERVKASQLKARSRQN